MGALFKPHSPLVLVNARFEAVRNPSVFDKLLFNLRLKIVCFPNLDNGLLHALSNKIISSGTAGLSNRQTAFYQFLL